jgi:hypothetical protein
MSAISTKYLRFFLLFFVAEAFFGTNIYGQKKKQSNQGEIVTVQSGPMVGYSEMKEVMLWVQTTKAAEVYFTYYEVSATGKPVQQSTEKVRTAADNAFTAKLIANKVEPGKKYSYQLYNYFPNAGFVAMANRCAGFFFRYGKLFVY